ncbi:zeta toxin family protein [Luteolibacter luteus]|uniref:Zeta toxin domain-containing protein n=1 Tax=Luteolibacter luteus TaxID=2728835 RepID=A0A858RQ31_9BACT|nr:zeta toxin family protein [Luteolibacter luteus]QJE99137.1 hypothetical protein HHL09_26270 [Luteolibacter luteus]
MTRVVIVLAGGGGSGKSSVLKRLNIPRDLVIDTTLSWENYARKTIAEIEASGRRAVVLYVHRPFARASEDGVIGRYLDGKEEGNPRLVPLRVAAEAHVGAQETALMLAQQGIRVIVMENSGALGTAKREDIEFLKKNIYTTYRERKREAGPDDHRRDDRNGRKGRRGGSEEGAGRGREQAIARLIAEGHAILERYRREGKLTDAEARAFRGEGNGGPDGDKDGGDGSPGDGRISFSISPRRPGIPEGPGSGSDSISKPTQGIAGNAAALDKNPNSNYDSTDERKTDNEGNHAHGDSIRNASPERTPRKGKDGVRELVARAKGAGTLRPGGEGAEFSTVLLGKEGVLKFPKKAGFIIYDRNGRISNRSGIEAAREKAMLIEALGGFPTEVIENDDGSFFVYQEFGDEISEAEYASLIVPKLNQQPLGGGIYRVELHGKTYQIGDLHRENFRKDKNGDIRITDLAGGEIDP